MDDKDYIKSLEKALNLLGLLSRHRSPLNLEQIVTISGLKKTSSFRILQTLTKAGYVSKDPDTAGYAIGSTLIAVGLAALDNKGIRDLALPYMKDIREKTGATVNLSILSGTEVVFVERLQSTHIIETNLRIGSRLPAYCSSMGKVILTFLPEVELDDILRQTRFEMKTEKTISSIKALKAELQEIRLKGFALNNEELATGLFAIAAPLRNHTGEAVAAMNISFPLIRHSKQEAMKTFLPLVVGACRKISHSLGFREAFMDRESFLSPSENMRGWGSKRTSKK
jgi:DNA-binding IclR family transcriptional regulator